MKIGFIGGGNMATALINGLIKSGKFLACDITLSDRDDKKLEKWNECGVNTTKSNLEVAENSDIIVFAVKPNVIVSVLEELSLKDKKTEKIYVSIAAGVSIEFLETLLGKDKNIIRSMPNTPAMVGCGMTVISPNANVSAENLHIIEDTLAGVGDTVVMDEKYINVVTALHGSSPAYIYMLIDAMADSGVKYGIPKNVSLKIAAKAVEGSAKMVLESDEHPMKLKDDVCSPGGTTIAAVCDLEKTGFKASIQSAIDECIKKANEMGA
ncbi:MAG: pyrroline-5-carboxylate reductase [Oscillospiraceae bacterium]